MKPFRDAWRGLVAFFKGERHAKVHLVFLIAALVLGAVVNLHPLEWCMVLLAAGLVIGLEAINTALEHLADAVHPDQHPLVGKAKDVAAGAVLFAAFISLIVGLLVFLPKL